MEFLYTIFIFPIEYILNLIFTAYVNVTDSLGLSVILLSFTVSLLMLPLFAYADKMQKQELQKQQQVNEACAGLEHVTNAMEQYFYKREIYKQLNYHPMYVFRGMMGILLQVPIFIGAFYMLSSYGDFNKADFAFINDLSKPDGLIRGTNVLPFALFFLSMISTYFYAVYSDTRQGYTPYLVNFLFFILLYKQAAAMTLYWCMNNVFLIVKNLFIVIRTEKLQQCMRFKDALKGMLQFYTQHIREFNFAIFCMLVYAVLFVYSVARFSDLFYKNAFSVLWMLNFCMVILYGNIVFSVLSIWQDIKNNTKWIVSILLAILLLINADFLIVSVIDYDMATDMDTHKLRIYTIAVECMICLGLVVYNWKNFFIPNASHENPHHWKWFYVLAGLPFALVMMYAAYNIDYFTLESFVRYVLYLIVLPYLVFVLLVKYILKYFLSTWFAYGALFSFMITIYSMPMISQAADISVQNNIIILITALLTITFGVLYTTANKHHIVTLFTASCAVLSVGFLTVEFYKKDSFTTKHKGTDKTAFSLKYKDNHTQNINGKEKLFSAYNINLAKYMDDKKYLDAGAMVKKPDIFLLIFDAYVSQKQMQKLYGIDNQTQMNWLQKNGFHFYDDVSSLYWASRGSMSRVLDLANPPYEHVSEMNTIIGGGSFTDNLLQLHGYKTNYATKYPLRKSSFNSDADFIHLYESERNIQNNMQVILKSILLGQFRFNADWIVKNSHQIPDFKVLKDMMNKSQGDPMFVYQHIGPGHSQNSGQCYPNEIDLYEDRVQKANQEMRDYIDYITKNHPDAIIIIASDHGPYLLGNCAEYHGYNTSNVDSKAFLDIFGTFLAIKWPDDTFSAYDKDITHIQDIFFAVFSYLFEDAKIKEFDIPSDLRKMRDNKNWLLDNVVQVGQDRGKNMFDVLNKSD